jgi:hypothetical protein
MDSAGARGRGWVTPAERNAIEALALLWDPHIAYGRKTWRE